jgi:endo-1,4-beta-xylanase
MRKLLVLLFTLAFASISQAKLQFFGGVTDPGLWSGQYPFSWPDTLFLRQPYNQVTCQDSTSEYQIQTGVSEFRGISDLGWLPLDQMYGWTRIHNYTFTWYGGFVALISDWWPAKLGIKGSEVVKMMTNWVAAAGSRYPKIEYINYANEPMHAGPNGNMQQAFGGAGTTGYDWIINMGKLFRKYFPKSQLGINEFDVESVADDLQYGEPSRLQEFLSMVRALKAAGVVDWVGLESYSLETVPSANFTSAVNQIGALGVKIILTEFSPEAHKVNVPEATKLADWQRLLPLAASNQYVIGVTGPWTYRKSDNGGVNGSQWIVDDTVIPAKDSPTMTWLKSYLDSTIQSGRVKAAAKKL